MKVSVFGPRVLTKEQEKNVLIIWTKFVDTHKNTIFLHGGSKGVQELIKKYLQISQDDKKSDVVLFKPWHMINKKLEYTSEYMLYRNIQILDNSDLVFIFELGDSDHLKWTKDYCYDKGIATYVIIKDKNEND